MRKRLASSPRTHRVRDRGGVPRSPPLPRGVRSERSPQRRPPCLCPHRSPRDRGARACLRPRGRRRSGRRDRGGRRRGLGFDPGGRARLRREGQGRPRRVHRPPRSRGPARGTQAAESLRRGGAVGGEDPARFPTPVGAGQSPPRVGPRGGTGHRPPLGRRTASPTRTGGWGSRWLPRPLRAASSAAAARSSASPTDRFPGASWPRTARRSFPSSPSRSTSGASARVGYPVSKMGAVALVRQSFLDAALVGGGRGRVREAFRGSAAAPLRGRERGAPARGAGSRRPSSSRPPTFSRSSAGSRSRAK